MFMATMNYAKSLLMLLAGSMLITVILSSSTTSLNTPEKVCV